MELFFKNREEWRKWLNDAKRTETRSGRILKIIEAAKLNKRPGIM